MGHPVQRVADAIQIAVTCTDETCTPQEHEEFVKAILRGAAEEIAAEATAADEQS